MLVVWAFATFATEAPGYVHLLLTLGVFLLIWRITVRKPRQPKPPSKAGARSRRHVTDHPDGGFMTDFPVDDTSDEA